MEREKTFELLVPETGDSAVLDKVKEDFYSSGVIIASVSEIPPEESLRILKTKIKKQKTDLYALELEGKKVSGSLRKQHDYTLKLLDCVQSKKARLLKVSVEFDTQKISKREAQDFMEQARKTIEENM